MFREVFTLNFFLLQDPLQNMGYKLRQLGIFWISTAIGIFQGCS